MTSAIRPSAGWATTPPAEAIRLSNDSTVARWGRGDEPCQIRLRMGCAAQSISSLAISSASATQKLLAQPQQTPGPAPR
jgi:hypothetical protein